MATADALLSEIAHSTATQPVTQPARPHPQAPAHPPSPPATRSPPNSTRLTTGGGTCISGGMERRVAPVALARPRAEGHLDRASERVVALSECVVRRVVCGVVWILLRVYWQSGWTARSLLPPTLPPPHTNT
jgi:hypothetical protein